MKQKQKPKSRWGLIVGILILLFIASYIFFGVLLLLFNSTQITSGNVAIIPIKGIITTAGERGLFDDAIASSDVIVNYIEDAKNNPSIDAIVLEIDSPGGAPVATDEIASAVKRTNKTTVAWIRETGASGAYWIASSSDYVISNRMSITGSVGVIGSYLDFSGFLNDWNVSYERLVGGRYKDLGVPYRTLSAEEKRMLQNKIDLIHKEFKMAVKENRKLTDSELALVGTGEFFLGLEAIKLGLVDELGGQQEVKQYLSSRLNKSIEFVRYEHSNSFFEMLAGVISKDVNVDFGTAKSSGITLE